MIFNTNQKYEQALLSTLLYIETHLEEDLGLDVLAERVGFSAFHFHRIFREAIGEAMAITAAAGEPAAPVPPRESSLDLSPRELDVVRLLAQGYSDKEIAATLYIGVRTAQTHVANVFAKLGVNGRAEAAAIAVRRGLA